MYKTYNIIKIIGIDCASFATRPNQCLNKLLPLFGAEYKEPVSMHFGAWTWDFTEDIDDETWKLNHSEMISVIQDMRDKGFIRGAIHSKGF